jgi:uncharacterized repeat protein (TIGR03837 family)
MAPEAQAQPDGRMPLSLQNGNIEVRSWDDALAPAAAMSKVWVEAFGCELPAHFLSWAQQAKPETAEVSMPVWVNLEYLSAESYVERSHKLPSPVMSGPLKGRTKWFFYPGFTSQTGGLIRELELDASLRSHASQAFDALSAKPHSSKTTLFCYAPEALTEALQLSSLSSEDHEWQIAHGRGASAFDAALTLLPKQAVLPRFRKVPPLPQAQFDQLLHSSDLNFVRGEDSLVRALWAGKALIWHIYPQDDGAHGPKLNAFLDWLQAPHSLRQFHLRWNGLSPNPLPEIDLPAWQACVHAARQRLLSQTDLVSQLLQFVEEKR